MDDAGQVHKLMIPNSIYDPQGYNLLSPQQWEKYCGNKGAGSTTTVDNVTLFWGNNKNTEKIRLNRNSNVEDLHLVPSYHDYQTFLKEAGDAEGEVNGTN